VLKLMMPYRQRSKYISILHNVRIHIAEATLKIVHN
jgi:hypothetical protein